MLTQVAQANDLFYLLSDDAVAMATTVVRGKSGAPVVYKLVVQSKDDAGGGHLAKKCANNSRLPGVLWPAHGVGIE